MEKKKKTTHKKVESKSVTHKQATGGVKVNGMNVTMVLVFVLGLVVGVAGSSAYWYQQKTKGFLPMDQLSAKVESFVSKEIFGGQIQVKVKDMEPMGSLAKFKIEIPNRGEFTSYVTRQGDLLFPEGIEVKEVDQNQVSQPAQPATGSGEVTGSDETPNGN